MVISFTYTEYMCFCMHPKLTLFPRQPMIPEPMHDASRWWMNGLRLLLTQIEVKRPTICLLLMHLKPSPCIEPSNALLFEDSWFNFAPSFLSFLLSASPIREFHFADIQLFVGPSTFLAFSGTISWNLKHQQNRSYSVGTKHHFYNRWVNWLNWAGYPRT